MIATVTGVAPAPAQALSLNGQPVGSADAPAMLFENVVQAWGNLSKPLGPEDVLQDTMGTKLVKYFFVPTNATALDNYTFAVNMEDLELQEGYYALSAKVSWLRCRYRYSACSYSACRYSACSCILQCTLHTCQLAKGWCLNHATMLYL
jgi:hypothetical protein